MHKLLSVAVVLTAFAACSTEDAPKQDPQTNPPAVQATETQAGGALAVYDVKCGCSIPGVGKCGNFIMIDGNYVRMIHGSLGKMEFCGYKDAGAKVEAKGAMQDGEFVCQTWKLVE